MTQVWVVEALPLVLALGQPDGPPSFYRALYAAFPVALGLAILNGLLAFLIGVLLYYKLDERPWALVVEGWTRLSVWLQVLLGLAPLLLIVRAIRRDLEFSLAVYGMPICQILILIFCLHFQFRLLRVYRARRQTGSGHHRS